MSSSPIEAVENAVRGALRAAFGGPDQPLDPQVRSSGFADFQSNAALGLAHALGRSPRDIAAALVAALQPRAEIERVEISGPGYLNVWIADEWLSRRIVETPPPNEAVGETVVIDYSSPNVAKQMHVGHLRTTIVGDALARIHEALGNTVIRQNHIGDWGTPFGMLLEHVIDVGGHATGSYTVAQMADLYKASRQRFDLEEGFADRARGRVVKLQSEDAETSAVWQHLVDSSIDYFTETYRVLGVTMQPKDIAGESSYRHELDEIADELTARGLTRVSEGALCVFPDGFTSRTGAPLPLIIRKSDGGYTYAATDLAAIRRRVSAFGASRLLYVVGEPQHVHFMMLFATARAAGWLPETTRAEHVQIGNVLGGDGKILRSRSGETPSLASALVAAVESAEEQLREGDGRVDDEHVRDDARIIGVGALKFADLITHHDAEYVFDIERMLKPQGQTGPYVQYAVMRIKRILARAGEGARRDAVVRIAAPQERVLALRLSDFERVISDAARLSQPHLIAEHLVSVAQLFNEFYDRCPVLKAETPEVRDSRLSLCRLTGVQLVEGLGLLGIDVPTAM